MADVIHPASASDAQPGQVVKCWSCKGPVSTRALFCHTCGTIQPPQQVDHFTRLGLVPRYDVDAAELERAYFGYQRVVHPDRFASKSAREKALSQSQAVSINEAFETLRDPLARAIYLLALRGAPLPADDKTVNDPELLMAAMEDREALDDAGTAAQLDAFARQTQDKYEQTVNEIGALFGRDDLAGAARLTLTLRYLAKLRDEVRAKRGRVGDAR